MQASVFLVSYPSTASGLPSGVRDAQRAMQQWLLLCDHIVRAGGVPLVLDPPATAASTDGHGVSPDVLLATSRLGAIFVGARPGGDSSAVFLRAPGSVPAAADASGQADSLTSQLRRYGLKVQTAQHRWGGQADVLGLPRNRYILTQGTCSDPLASDEVAALLPMGAHALRVDIDRDSGLSAFNVLTTRAGATMVLVSTQALKTTSMAEISTFIGNKCELISLSAEDSAIGAGAMLCVHGNVFVPPGVSTTLRGHLWRFGFQVVDVDVSELGGAAIGLGPRAFALPWSQCMLDDALPTYATRRDELYRRLDEYAAK